MRQAVTWLGATSMLAFMPLMLWRRPTARAASTDSIQSALDLIQAQDRVIGELQGRLAPPTQAETPTRAETPPPPLPKAKPSRAAQIVHVVNPMPGGHGLHVDQQVTFASLVKAQRVAAESGIAVRLYTVELESEPRAPRPKLLEPGPNLTRHAFRVYDMGSRNVKSRTLPLIGDILEKAHVVSGGGSCNETRNGPLIVYTNADIGVQPDFYPTVMGYAQSASAFVINRVEIPDRDASGRLYNVADLDVIHDLGRTRPQRHAGYDCFVWRPDATDLLRLYTRGVFVGYPPVGKLLKDALKCVTGGRFREIKGRKHTFHLGERNGGWSQFTEYEHFNRKAGRRASHDFANLLGGPGRGCYAAMAALKAPDGDASRATRCKVADELRTRSFVRWDVPGSEWPPLERNARW